MADNVVDDQWSAAYDAAYEKCVLPKRRHYDHVSHLDGEIRRQLMTARFPIGTQPNCPQVQESFVHRVRDTWMTKYGFTFEVVSGGKKKKSTAVAKARAKKRSIKFPKLGKKKPLVVIDSKLSEQFVARYKTLDNILYHPKRELVVAIQNILATESVARCMEALFRKTDDIGGAIDWLSTTPYPLPPPPPAFGFVFSG